MNKDIIYSIIIQMDLNNISNTSCINHDFNKLYHDKHLLIEKFNQLPVKICKSYEYTYANLLFLHDRINVAKKTIEYIKLIPHCNLEIVFPKTNNLNPIPAEDLRKINVELLLKLDEIDVIYELKFLYNTQGMIYCNKWHNRNMHEIRIGITDDELLTYLTNFYINYNRIRLGNGNAFGMYYFESIYKFNTFMNENPAESLYWEYDESLVEFI